MAQQSTHINTKRKRNIRSLMEDDIDYSDGRATKRRKLSPHTREILIPSPLSLSSEPTKQASILSINTIQPLSLDTNNGNDNNSFSLWTVNDTNSSRNISNFFLSINKIDSKIKNNHHCVISSIDHGSKEGFDELSDRLNDKLKVK